MLAVRGVRVLRVLRVERRALADRLLRAVDLGVDPPGVLVVAIVSNSSSFVGDGMIPNTRLYPSARTGLQLPRLAVA